MIYIINKKIKMDVEDFCWKDEDCVEILYNHVKL